jgi:hypothetical protein
MDHGPKIPAYFTLSLFAQSLRFVGATYQVWMPIQRRMQISDETRKRSEDFTPFSSSSTIDKHSIPHLGLSIDLSRIPHIVCANSICR